MGGEAKRPAWAKSTEEKTMWATAVGYGAPADLLSEKEMVEAFLKTKALAQPQPQGGSQVVRINKLVIPQKESFEGITFSDQLLMNRERTVNSILRLLEHLLFLQIRSPPFSGKTSMQQLLYRALEAKHPVVALSLTRMGALNTHQTFLEYFEEEIGMSLQQFLGSTKSLKFLLVDEAQKLYGSINAVNQSLWALIKHPRADLRIVLTCSYGGAAVGGLLATPVQFPPLNQIHFFPRTLCVLSEVKDTKDKSLSPKDKSSSPKAESLPESPKNDENQDSLMMVDDGDEMKSDSDSMSDEKDPKLSSSSLKLRATKHEYPGLACRLEETKDFVSHLRFGVGLQVDESVAWALFNITGGHIGALRATVNFLMHRTANERKNINGAIMTALHSHAFLAAISNLRCFDCIAGMEPMKAKICQELLENGFLFFQTASNEHDRAKSDLIQEGVLVQTPGNRVTFSSPIMARKFFMTNYSTTTRPSVLDPKLRDIDHFVMSALARIDPNNLDNTLATDAESKHVYESQFQALWYQIVTSLLPLTMYASTNVGPRYGASGYLDSVVNSFLGFGFELLRDKNRMGEHKDRFLPLGKYAPLMHDNGGPLRDYRILDFHKKLPTKPVEREAKLYTIIRLKGEAHCLVYPPSGDPVKLILPTDRSTSLSPSDTLSLSAEGGD